MFTPHLAVGFLSLMLVPAVSAAQDEFLAGYLIIPTGERVERTYHAGFSMYVSAVLSPALEASTVRLVADAAADPDSAPMITIPDGVFNMGGPAFNNDAPEHRVNIPAFMIDQFAVTNDRFARFLNAVGRTRDERGEWFRVTPYFQLEKAGIQWRSRPGFERYPVAGVSWFGATSFARWAGKRLPTEAEWERAARGTDSRAYPWGNDWRPTACNNEDDRHRDASATPVDKYPDGRSPCGCYDMAGNVLEWTSSLYKPYPYDAQDGREDPAAPGPRVLRGGSWWDGIGAGQLFRSFTRYSYAPEVRSYFIGFRCARSVP
jgi:iron(II)-dependent oxidoreductase